MSRCIVRFGLTFGNSLLHGTEEKAVGFGIKRRKFQPSRIIKRIQRNVQRFSPKFFVVNRAEFGMFRQKRFDLSFVFFRKNRAGNVNQASARSGMLRAEFKNFSLNAEYFPQPLRRNAEFGVRRPPPGAAAGAGGVDDKTGVVFVLDILYGLYVKNVQPFRPFLMRPSRSSFMSCAQISPSLCRSEPNASAFPPAPAQ